MQSRWRDARSKTIIAVPEKFSTTVVLNFSRASVGGAEDPPTSHEDSLGVIGGRMGRQGRWKGQKTHQRVLKTRWWMYGPGRSVRGQKTHQRVFVTRWWSYGPARAVERAEDPPTSLKDSLVDVWAGEVSERPEDPPTSLHDSLVVVWTGEGQKNPPTSLKDSLVVVWAGGVGGKSKKTHQRVIRTRWWSYGPVGQKPTNESLRLVGSRIAGTVGGERRKTTNDSLVVVWASEVGGRTKKHTNEFLRLVGGRMGISGQELKQMGMGRPQVGVEIGCLLKQVGTGGWDRWV
jgi:hypothetical protein